jgi:uncharacterized protein YidB (DUF937 family)
VIRRAARALLSAMEDKRSIRCCGVIGAEALSLVKDYIEKRGGIQDVVAEFEKTGFGQQAKSWVSTGTNLPITAEQMHQALGSEKVKELAAKFGIPVDKVADLPAKHLPTAIDKATLSSISVKPP